MVKLRYSLIGVAVLAILSALLPWYSSNLQDSALDQAASGMQVESLHTAENAASMDPFSITALFTLAGAQQRVGWQTDARNTLIKATRIQPDNYQTWEQLALYERDRWNMPVQAKTDFEKAVELDPQNKELKAEAELTPVS